MEDPVFFQLPVQRAVQVTLVFMETLKVAAQNHAADLVNQVMRDRGSPLQIFSGEKRIPEHEKKFLSFCLPAIVEHA